MPATRRSSIRGHAAIVNPEALRRASAVHARPVHGEQLAFPASHACSKLNVPELPHFNANSVAADSMRRNVAQHAQQTLHGGCRLGVIITVRSDTIDKMSFGAQRTMTLSTLLAHLSNMCLAHGRPCVAAPRVHHWHTRAKARNRAADPGLRQAPAGRPESVSNGRKGMAAGGPSHARRRSS
jgi:hypothetical protein